MGTLHAVEWGGELVLVEGGVADVVLLAGLGDFEGLPHEDKPVENGGEDDKGVAGWEGNGRHCGCWRRDDVGESVSRGEAIVCPRVARGGTVGRGKSGGGRGGCMSPRVQV